jgi:dTDP-4-amino-4,6-dideoxygalactose transaminase
MNDFRAEPEALKARMREAASKVIDSGWYVLGNECKHFESAWARTCGTRHAIGVGNGMDAIELILRASGIGAGDEVITTPMTAFATVLAIIRAGARPVLADIQPGNALICPDSVARCLTARTRALVPVHLYGQLADVGRLRALCADHRLHLIEDCAQSHLAAQDGQVAGSFGVAGAYSFYPTKNLGAIGDAGAIVTSDDELAERAQRLRNYGQSQRYHHPDEGMNSRLDEMQAALLSVRLEWLSEFTARRRAIAARYRSGLTNPAIRLLDAPANAEAHVYHLFVVLCAERERLMAHLADRGVQSLIHYPVPVHHQPPCASVPRDPAGLTATEAHAKHCLTLPCHPQMTDEDVEQVVEACNDFRI